MPRAIFEYADQGSYDEVTFRRNRADLEALSFRQRVMVDVSQQSLATTLLGEQPCGYRSRARNPLASLAGHGRI